MTSPASTFVRVLTPSRELALRVEDLAAAAQLQVAVHICSGALADALANARGAKPDTGVLAVVEGKNGIVAALGAGVDEAVEAHVLTPELLVLAAKLATERRRSRKERDDLQRSLAQTARLAALGTVVAGVAHEVNNPATMITLQLASLAQMLGGVRASLLDLEHSARAWTTSEARADAERVVASARAALGEDAAEEAVRDCEAGIRMIADVVRDLRVMSSASDEAPPELVDVRRMVGQVLRLSGIEGDVGIHLERDFPDEVPLLWLPRSRVLQIFANLVSNSAYAMRASSRPLRRLRIVIRLDDTALMVAFVDTGVGIAPERLRRLFEPFYTTKGPEHGTGLGLYMSRQIVRRLGGDLTVDSVEGRGTTAMVFLPLALQTASTPERKEARPPRTPRVLVAHDDAEQLLVLRTALKNGYEVALAQGAIEALDLVESGARVDAIVCGRDEPSIDGESLGQRLARDWPHLAKRTVLLEEVLLPGAAVDRQRLRDAIERRLRAATPGAALSSRSV